ncbi:hypothetical protein EU528_01880 [Candidatus Thorarchaeota archaeon]|nr:MAG: hypothetical protein EU528_01880 [Candidatus Thorarchaeota archaeon]
MSWISKIINGTPDEFVKAKLVKYGIGSHPGPRARISLSKASIKIKADLDQEKDFLKGYLLGAPDGQHKAKGMIITYTDNTKEYAKLTMPISWSKSKGKGIPVFKAKVDESAPLADIKALFDIDDPTTFYLLSLNPRNGTKPWKITTKTSFPKGGPKEEEEDEAAKDPVFAKGAIGNTPETLEFILDAYLPDHKDKIGPKTKDIWIRNNFEILDIKPPDDPKLSFAEKRRLAKKKCILIRDVAIDGVEYQKEYKFIA